MQSDDGADKPMSKTNVPHSKPTCHSTMTTDCARQHSSVSSQRQKTCNVFPLNSNLIAHLGLLFLSLTKATILFLLPRLLLVLRYLRHHFREQLQFWTCRPPLTPLDAICLLPPPLSPAAPTRVLPTASKSKNQDQVSDHH